MTGYLATCPDCGGTGSFACGLCGGSGESATGAAGEGTCGRCDGKGDRTCATCEGSGKKRVTHIWVAEALTCAHCDDDAWIGLDQAPERQQAWIDRHATCADRARGLEELEARNRAAALADAAVDETLPPTSSDLLLAQIRRLT